MARTNAAVSAGEVTRTRILDAATDAFGARGFHGASLDDIAQRSGVARTAILHHFGSKTGVLVALLSRRDEAVHIMESDEVSSSSNPAARLLRDIRRRSPEIMAAQQEMQLAHVLEAEAAAPGHPAREWVARRADRIRRYFASHFARASWAHGIQTSADPEILAVITLALIEGLEAQWLVDPEAIDMDRALEAYEALILHSLRTEPPAAE